MVHLQHTPTGGSNGSADASFTPGIGYINPSLLMLKPSVNDSGELLEANPTLGPASTCRQSYSAVLDEQMTTYTGQIPVETAVDAHSRQALQDRSKRSPTESLASTGTASSRSRAFRNYAYGPLCGLSYSAYKSRPPTNRPKSTSGKSLRRTVSRGEGNSALLTAKSTGSHANQNDGDGSVGSASALRLPSTAFSRGGRKVSSNSVTAPSASQSVPTIREVEKSVYSGPSVAPPPSSALEEQEDESSAGESSGELGDLGSAALLEGILKPTRHPLYSRQKIYEMIDTNSSGLSSEWIMYLANEN
jgi:hypothetical protein